MSIKSRKRKKPKGTPRRNKAIILLVYGFVVSLGTAHVAEMYNQADNEAAVIAALQVCIEGECGKVSKAPRPPVMPEWIAENREFNAQLAQALEE